MSFKLSALLNPASEPSSPKAQPSQTSPAPEAPTSNAAAPAQASGREEPATALYEAADALTGLAHGGPSPRASLAFESGSPFASNNDQYGSSAAYPEARRASSYGSVAGPVEPLTVETVPQQSSPSLEQYHHGSKSPEEQRRLSFMSISSNPTILPPIHSLEGISERGSGDHAQPQHTSSYGHDASQIVRTSSAERTTADGQLSPNTAAQNREPDYVRDEPTTTQIRAPSPQTHPAELSTVPPSITSPPSQVKLEPTATSREPTPAQAATQTEQGNNLDSESLRAVADLKNEHGLRGASREESTATASTAPTMDPSNTSPSATRKRKPVDSKVKKGPSGKKPSSKKRKVEDEPGRPSPTPSSRASASKAKGAKKSQTGTPVTGSSPAPFAQSSPAPQTAEEEEEEESGSDDGIYCICRKGDNHTWMIACDGSCQDWYHGKCVDVKESDGDLIEKYFCPRCTEAGEGRTTWKRMCRRQGCRRPARRDEQSKYCSDECGVQFFKDVVVGLRGGSQAVANGAAAAAAAQKNKRDRRKANNTENTHNDGEETEDDASAGPRGGVVSARDLKALSLAARGVDHFKSLGNSILSPPATASPSSPNFPHAADQPPLSASDAARVAAIQAEIAELRQRFELLKDRERFVAMTREQATQFAEREGVKPKDICGYDARLAWSEGEFALWRKSAKGRACLKQESLEAEPEKDEDQEMKDAAANGDAKADVKGEAEKGGSPIIDGDGDVDMMKDGVVDGTTNVPPQINGTAAATSSPASKRELDVLPTLLALMDLCPRKRCQRHTQWIKVASYDVQFELSIAKQAIAELGAEEREIRERALVSWRKEKGNSGAMTEAGEGERLREGWVEVLG